MTMRHKPKRKRVKFTTSAKVTLAAMSVMGFIGGWDLIARLESSDAQAGPQIPDDLLPALRPVTEPAITPTPWPTIPPLAVNCSPWRM